jgi:hypothetical protein
MDSIEEATELYDLFGESIFCAVCQEDVGEGERVRTIRQCQHGFHSSCVDRWLIKENSCPVCRRTVIKQRANYTAQTYPGFILAESDQNDLQRYILAYCLADGILRKFKKAEPFRENSTNIRATLANFHLETVRPFPLDSCTRNSLFRSRNKMRGEIIRRLSLDENARAFNRIPVIGSLYRRISVAEGNIRSLWSIV